MCLHYTLEATSNQSWEHPDVLAIQPQSKPTPVENESQLAKLEQLEKLVCEMSSKFQVLESQINRQTTQTGHGNYPRQQSYHSDNKRCYKCGKVGHFQ